ncbi:unnamed protein product [Pelagomonas calceolata]|uniref:MYND-type domain-containing protein n=1 Tax=Pelagomonas calceolata TaxID=35677 RepID=A0A8J2SKB9_9STRA|nr:unnamed protein product [Pelagomonas calceolata]|mmetsp:Transcript_11641/g.35789  ORF Transcript_11641/g.35789 Transcript_11641/m.35789 type:complete len:227 (+) Transcript_11641:112-792(+)
MTESASEQPSPSDTTCAAPGCLKEAHLKCSRCQTVRYCSKACQVTHWKAGHSKACRAAPGAPANRPEEPAPDAPAAPEDALARQDRLLRESPRADYVVEVDKTHDRAVAFERMQDRLLFRMLRGKAGKRCRRSLYLMNDILAKAQPEHAERIRQQLRSEYGVDPLECKNAPVGGLKLGADAPSFDDNMADIVRAMRAGNIDDNALQAEMEASAERLAARKRPVKPR